jgi:Bacterial SH3 domain
VRLEHFQRSTADFPYVTWVALILCLLAAPSVAQSPAVEHLVHAPKADVEHALQRLHADSEGRLPTLHGFVSPGKVPFSHYQQGRYDFDLQVTSMSATESLVRVRADITAWYQDEDPSRSGYQDLPSSGRLEADLLERLENALRTGTQVERPSGASEPAGAPGDKITAPELPAATNLPDSPSASKAALWLSARSGLSASPANQQNAEPQAASDATHAKLQQLQKEEKSLQEVLHNQVKPKDLAIVKKSGTRVRLRPADDAQVILVAEEDDELQVLERNEDWVRVQLSGPARGWIRAEQLDLAGVSVPSVTPGKSFAHSQEPALQTTREETAIFPGDWEPLRGKQVQIIWVQPGESAKGATPAKSMDSLQQLLRVRYAHSSDALSKVAGVVVVLDSADGGMMATTVSALRRWQAGNLSNALFWRQCWFDPPSAFSYVR